MKRVLITGSEGFTGKYLVTEMEQHGWEVWRTGTSALSEAKRYRKSNLSDTESLKRLIHESRPDVVMHLAAVSFVGHGNPDNLYQVNLIGTRNLLAALSESPHPLSCVLLASSANIYGNSEAEILDESIPAAPANDYAVSKLAMEYMAHLWAGKLPMVFVRPFNYTGSGQSASFVIPKIIQHFQAREKVIELGNLDVWRDYSDVRSVVNAYRRLVEACPIGQTVNVCSGGSYSLREVLSMAQSISGHQIQVEVNPDFVRENEVKKLMGSPEKLRGIIGDWKSISFENTLEWMLAS